MGLSGYLTPTALRARSVAVSVRAHASSDIQRWPTMGSNRCTATVWGSVNFRKPSTPCRRDSPEAFIPPIGAPTLPHAAAYPSLMLTMPVSSELAIRRPRATSRVQTEALERAEVGVVGQPHRLLVGTDGVDGHDRAEGLLVPAGHGGSDPLQHRRLVEEGADIRSGPAPDEHPRALDPGIRHVRLDPLHLRRGRQ